MIRDQASVCVNCTVTSVGTTYNIHCSVKSWYLISTDRNVSNEVSSSAAGVMVVMSFGPSLSRVIRMCCMSVPVGTYARAIRLSGSNSAAPICDSTVKKRSIGWSARSVQS